jgi:hypothetical protein
MRHLAERNPVGAVENEQEIPDRAAVGNIRDSETSRQDSQADDNQANQPHAKGISAAGTAKGFRIRRQSTARQTRTATYYVNDTLWKFISLLIVKFKIAILSASDRETDSTAPHICDLYLTGLSTAEIQP